MLALVLLAFLSPRDPSQPTFPATEPLAALRLWEGAAPLATGEADTDVPTLTPFVAPATRATDAAAVVFPGGGYRGLAGHEGIGYARWLKWPRDQRVRREVPPREPGLPSSDDVARCVAGGASRACARR